MTDEPTPESVDLIAHEIQQFGAGLERLTSMKTVTGHDVQEAILPCLAALESLADAVRRLEGELE